MEKKINVLVLFGGRSGEHEVSLMSARAVLDNLDRNRYDVYQVAISHQGEWYSAEPGIDVLEEFSNEKYDSLHQVFMLPSPSDGKLYSIAPSSEGGQINPFAEVDVVVPVLHGTFGEDGTLQGYLELADVAYTGAGVLGSSVGMDKGVFKDVMKANGIPVVESLVILRSEIEKDLRGVLEKSEKVSGYPLFVKPANLGSSVGVSKCLSRSDLLEGLVEAARYDRRIIIERGVNAREIEVSVLGNDNPEASVPGEVLPSREFYSYESKYLDGTSGLLIPAPLTDELALQVRQIAVQAYQAIDCSGMARVDFLLDKDTHQLYLNELNTIPGFTQISMYAKLWEASGISYPQLLGRLINLAFERKDDRDRTERQFKRES
jgi:D-alanine-D-alanine ligase